MGNPNFTIGPGEGVFVGVPWDPQGREVTVTLTFKPLRGRGRDRQRCEARYNGHRATIERRPVDPEEEAASDD